MAYYIQKPSLVDSAVTVYYAGNKRWSDDASNKIIFASEEEANAVISNPDGTNGGWTNATIVSE